MNQKFLHAKKGEAEGKEGQKSPRHPQPQPLLLHVLQPGSHSLGSARNDGEGKEGRKGEVRRRARGMIEKLDWEERRKQTFYKASRTQQDRGRQG